VKKIALLLLCFGLCVSSFAEDTLRDQVFVLDSFDGGLNQKLDPLKLPKNQGDIVENCRFSTSLKALSKRTSLNVFGTADAVEPITGMHRYYKSDGTKSLLVTHGDEIEKGSDSAGTFSNILNLSSADRRWQFLTWHNLAIGTDGYNQPIKYDGTSVSATYLGSCLATLATSGSGPATGSYTYKVSFYTSTYEVLFDTASNTITADGNDVNLSMIPIGPTTYLGESVLGRRIYRTQSNGSAYKLLSNNTPNTIAGNTTTILTDSDADGGLGAAMPYDADGTTWKPPLAKYCIVHKNRLFLADDPVNNSSRIWYSDDGSHDIFQSDHYLDIRQNDGDSITFIKEVLGILTIGKYNSIQKIYTNGSDPSADWEISAPFSFTGCHAPYSAVYSPLGLIYLSSDGIYKFNGQYSSLISEAITPLIQNINPSDLNNVFSIFHENTLYMAYTSNESIAGINDKVLTFDILSNAYNLDSIYTNCFAAFSSQNDFGILYTGSSSDGKVYAYETEPKEFIHKRHSDFAGLWDDMRYVPTTVGGDAENPVLEIARTETIDDLYQTISSTPGLIDRQDYLGHYISQVVTIGQCELDKLYWNESIPSAGGDVSFRLRSSATGESNLLLNDDFEFWDNYEFESPITIKPNDWRYSKGGTGGSSASDRTIIYSGQNSVKVTKSSMGYSTVYQRIGAVIYQSKPMVFSGWYKSANSIAGKVVAEIQDSVATKPTQAFYSCTAGWNEFETSVTVDSTATSLTVRLLVDSDANQVAYFDKVMVRQGTSTTNDWTEWGTEYKNQNGSDISAATSNTYLQYLISETTSSLAYTPTLTESGGYVVRLTYNRTGAQTTDSIPIRWRTGWFDMGQPSRTKSLKYIYVYHTGTAGTLNLTFENYEGDTDLFSIDLTQYPDSYREAFTGGKFTGQQFRLDITNNDANPLTISKIICIYDVEPEGPGR